MFIKVCDAIMGSGKTSATINLINSNPDKRYIYITPFLSEAARITDSCPHADFASPESKVAHGSKQGSLLELLEHERNIATTHALFKNCPQATLDVIHNKGYTIIIDEAVDVFAQTNFHDSDYRVLAKAGYVSTSDNGDIIVNRGDYTTGKFEEFFDMAQRKELVQIGNSASTTYLWLIPIRLFEMQCEIYVLTYQFKYSALRMYFDLNSIEYKYIGISHPSENLYFFNEKPDYIPSYVRNLAKMIHIFDNDKLNAIGDRKTALSATWFHNNASKEKGDQLRKNIYNYFRYYHKAATPNQKMWSVFTSSVEYIRAGGYRNNHVVYNCKATNAYKDRNVLAYCVNIFFLPQVKSYFLQHGVEIYEDGYALSVMLQWIWRSAIRDGEEIWLYVPSKRMRCLLMDWIAETQKEYYKRYNLKED